MNSPKTAVLTFSTVLLAFPALASTLPQPDRIEEAKVLLSHGDFNRARALLEPLSADRQGIEAWFLLGKLSYLSGEIDKAVELLEKASKGKPDSSQYFLWLGRALGRKAEQAFPLRGMTDQRGWVATPRPSSSIGLSYPFDCQLRNPGT